MCALMRVMTSAGYMSVTLRTHFTNDSLFHLPPEQGQRPEKKVRMQLPPPHPVAPRVPDPSALVGLASSPSAAPSLSTPGLPPGSTLAPSSVASSAPDHAASVACCVTGSSGPGRWGWRQCGGVLTTPPPPPRGPLPG